MAEPISSVIQFTSILISPWLARINSLSRVSVSPNLQQTDKTEPVMHTDGIKEETPSHGLWIIAHHHHHHHHHHHQWIAFLT